MADAAGLEGVPLFVDPDLVREEHLHHCFALGFLGGALWEEAGAEFVGLVVGVVDVVLAGGVVCAAFDELGKDGRFS